MPGKDERTGAFVGLGSNLGDSAALLKAAGAALSALPGISLVALSPLYRSQPQDFADQPFFLNGVAHLDCPLNLEPEELLDMLLGIEAGLGRDRSRELPKGPRPLDLDLLLFGNRVMTGGRLVLPHPRMLERAFVLLPLADLAPDLALPGGPALVEALAAIDYRLEGGVIFQGAPASHGQFPAKE